MHFSFIRRLGQSVLTIKGKGTSSERQINTKASIQPRISFFNADADIEVGDIVKVLVSGEERKAAEVHFVYGRGNIVHHKEVKLVSIKK